MIPKTLRVVFFIEMGASAEVVPSLKARPCSECGTQKKTCLTGDEIEAIGGEAADVIYEHTDSRWYDGLIRQLVRQNPHRFRTELDRVDAQ